MLQPFTILEEIGRIIFVEEIPPFGGVSVESFFSKSRISRKEEEKKACQYKYRVVIITNLACEERY